MERIERQNPKVSGSEAIRTMVLAAIGVPTERAVR
jgi:hypothetical protein